MDPAATVKPSDKVVDLKVPPAQGDALTPQKAVDRLLPHWKPKTAKPDATPTVTGGTTGTAEPGTGPTGSQPGTPSKPGNGPLRNFVKKILPHKPVAAAAGTGTGTSAKASGEGSKGGE